MSPDDKQDNLLRDFIKYIIPAVTAQWVYTLYAIVDGMFVSRGVSEKAFAAVSLSYPYVSLLFALSLAFAVGTSAVASIYMGEGDHETACERFTQNICVNLVIGVILTVLSLVFLSPICMLLGDPDPEILDAMKQYIGNIAPFSCAFLMSYSFEILMKADGFPEKSTLIVSFGVVFNIILDYVFVIVLKRGAAGAAFATGLTQLILTVIYLSHFVQRKGRLKFTRFRFVLSEQLRIFRNGMSSGITEFAPGMLTFIFNRFILMYLDADKVITYSIADYASCLIILSCNGLAQGAQPLISFYHGACEESKVKRLFKYLMVSSLAFCLISLVVMYAGAGVFTSLFLDNKESELYLYTVKFFRIFMFNLAFAGFNLAMSGYYTSVERAFEAMLISLCRSFLLIVLFLVIFTQIFDKNSIWWASPAAEAATFIIAALTLFRRPMFEYDKDLSDDIVELSDGQR